MSLLQGIFDHDSAAKLTLERQPLHVLPNFQCIRFRVDIGWPIQDQIRQQLGGNRAHDQAVAEMAGIDAEVVVIGVWPI